ncbi:MAG TPA: type 4a pilus biogenesis protein PilO [Legionella sp.]|nr:type 4a pilus biogenesis protein PilO [Legionella sp.]
MHLRFNKLTLDFISEQSNSYKAFVLMTLFISSALTGYWFMLIPRYEFLNRIRNQEIYLKAEFKEKYDSAKNLPGYTIQVQNLKQLLEKSIPLFVSPIRNNDMAQNISKYAVSSGLIIELFAPLPDEKKGFYTELPIHYKFTGNYTQWRNFLQKIEEINKLIIVDDLTISMSPYNKVLVINCIIKVLRYRFDEDTN